MNDTFNLEQALTETLFNYYGDNERPCIRGTIRTPENEIPELRVDDNMELIKNYIDGIIRCDEEE